MLAKPVNKKAQTAMEFLVSYSWAIFVVILAIGALFYFGSMNAEKFLPDACVLAPGFTCADFRIEPTEVVLVLRNSLGSTITLNNITIANSNGNSCLNTNSISFPSGSQAIFTVPNCDNGAIGGKFMGRVLIGYTKGVIYREIPGEITASVSGSSTTSTQSICQGASDGGICNGLDVAYGQGYQAACCSEHTLCC